MSYAVGGACRILHHSLLEALKGYPEDSGPREFDVFFIGHSLGGAVALQAAEVVARQFGIDGNGGKSMDGLNLATVRLRGICTLNGALDIRKHRPNAWDALSETHMLLISGDADEVVPPEATEQMYQDLPAKSKRHLTFPEGTHDLFNHKSQLLEQISEFIVSHLDVPEGYSSNDKAQHSCVV
jgi:pimeloyl-ACP methyl ester carboxylesterase